MRDHGGLLKRTYLDHASTAPLRASARVAMDAMLDDPVGDPSRSHREGMRARHIVEVAREQVAGLFGARPREVVFCSGATEAIAMASYGTASRGTRSILGAVEHSAVREWAERGEHTIIGVDRLGRVDADSFIAALGHDVSVAHLQVANHEVGTLQPVHQVAAAARENGILMHCDAAAGAGRIPIDFRTIGDLVSVSSHKLGGPPGVGALMIRRGLRIDPLAVGGDQERARRAGMENVVAIAGFGAACAELSSTLDLEARHCRQLTDMVTAWVRRTPGCEVLGDADERVPHIECLAIDGVEPQAVLLGLDAAGIAVHSGNSCSSEALEPSPVLAAMGVDAHRSLRISVGPETTSGQIDHLLTELPLIISGLRSLR